jgi:hypothetical protein
LNGTVLGQAVYTYVGPNGGDFFDVNNWEDSAGMNPSAGSIPDSTTGEIALDMQIVGSSVVANGQVDFGTGSISLLNSAFLDVTGAGNDFDMNGSSSISVANSTLRVDGDIQLNGLTNMNSSVVTSLTDDVEFAGSMVNYSIVDTVFSAGDNAFFRNFAGAISGGSITTADRLGLDSMVTVPLTDVVIDVNGGFGDVDDVFAADGAGSTLILNGVSSLLADTVEEGVNLELHDFSIATLGNNGIEYLDNGSTLTIFSRDAFLTVADVTTDARSLLINGVTGMSYLDDPSTWTVANWNGTDGVTLGITSIPEPSSYLILISLGCVAAVHRRKR